MDLLRGMMERGNPINVRVIDPEPSPARDHAKWHVTLVRGPIVGAAGSINNEATPCIALAYLSAYVKRHGYQVEIVDAIGEGLLRYWEPQKFPGYLCQGLRVEELIARVPARTDVIAFSAMFSGEWPMVREMIVEFRKYFPDKIFVAGGEHVTALPELSLRDCPAIDYCVLGEGEYPFYELLEALRLGRDVSALPSIAFLNSDGAYVSSGTLTRLKTLDKIPWPDWPEGYLEKFWAAGKSYGICTERDMPFLVSRGCPYQCAFCSNRQMYSTRYVLRGVDDAICEIKGYVKKYGITGLQFYDLTAIVRKQWIVEFCHALLREKIAIKWSLPSGTRSEALDTETLSLLKQTGCNYLVYAPESGSPATLERIKKKIHLPDMMASVFEAKRLGLVIRTNLIIGFPEETRGDVFQTLLFGLKMGWNGVDEPSINIFSPYPGSEIFHRLFREKELSLNDDYFLALTSLNSDYTRLNPLTFNRRMGPRELAVYRFAFMALNYLIGYFRYPSRILRTIRNLASSSSAFKAETVLEHRLKDLIRRRRRRFLAVSSAQSRREPPSETAAMK